ncbi:MAG TPA: nucleotide disphospho-sugar-binding domain-containing protein [Chitinophagaceae bacterium]
MKSETFFNNEPGIDLSELAVKKILFATFPGDGHFNPLTGIAMHLKKLGSDVRWYTSDIYTCKLKDLQIQHYPFKKALNMTGESIDHFFPERKNIKGKVAKLNFDIINAFVLRGPEYYADLQEVHKEFPFDIMIADNAFTGIPFVIDKMNIPVIAIGVFPLTETSKDLPPAGLGLMPSYSFIGKMKQGLLRWMAQNILFKKSNKVTWKIFDEYGIKHNKLFVFDITLKKSNLLLQSGTPGFEYYRSDLGSNIRYIGPLLPYTSKKQRTPWFDARLNQYEKIVVVTQGTVEKDVEKIIVPTLEAFKDTGTLVIATTGGSSTAELKARFPQKNLIIEDFIPFADIMPYADVYITNGGYGGVMLGIENQLPLVVAGVHEGKNEINARIGYFKLGVNLNTEKPKPAQLKKAVEEIFSNNIYKENVIKLGNEFRGYNPNELAEFYVKDMLRKTARVHVTEPEKIY